MESNSNSSYYHNTPPVTPRPYTEDPFTAHAAITGAPALVTRFSPPAPCSWIENWVTVTQVEKLRGTGHP
ncbi:hypothetical protein MGN70_010876 [Eutypa lata]|nr:hypothetical protein MGN70_010876 [Eutypa lata]